MKAAVLHRKRDIRIEERPMPDAPGPGEVLLRVRSVGICGSDIHTFTDFEMSNVRLTAPQIIGHECGAEVVKVGDGVKNLKAGHRVTVEPSRSCGECEWCRVGMPNVCPEVKFLGFPGSPGALQEFIVLPAEQCIRVPDDMSFENATLLEPLQVSIHAVNLVPTLPGEYAAVIGCGVIGLGCLELVKLAGATKIIATDKLDYRLEAARKLGADCVVNVTKEDVAEKVNAFTDGRGPHKVYECTNTTGGPPQAVEVAAIGAHVALAGIPDEDFVNFTAHAARRKQLTLQFIRRSCHTSRQAIELVASGRVDLGPCVTHRFALADTQKAFEMVESYADGVIKAIINP